MKTPTRYILPIAAIGLAMASRSFSAVLQVDTFSSTSPVDGLSYLDIDASGLDFTGASKLVVTIGAEGAAANGQTPGSISSLTYGGVDLIEIESGAGGRSSIWYVDLAGKSFADTNFDLVFAGDNGAVNTDVRGYFLSAYTLSGTADGVSSSGVSTTNLVSVSPTTANEYVIVGYSRNGNGQNATPFTAGLNLLEPPGNVSLESQYTNASIYGTISSPGTQDLQIDGMTNNAGALAAATFAAIPEPSTTLLGLGGLALLLRRRR